MTKRFLTRVALSCVALASSFRHVEIGVDSQQVHLNTTHPPGKVDKRTTFFAGTRWTLRALEKFENVLENGKKNQLCHYEADVEVIVPTKIEDRWRKRPIRLVPDTLKGGVVVGKIILASSEQKPFYDNKVQVVSNKKLVAQFGLLDKDGNNLAHDQILEYVKKDWSLFMYKFHADKEISYEETTKNMLGVAKKMDVKVKVNREDTIQSVVNRTEAAREGPQTYMVKFTEEQAALVNDCISFLQAMAKMVFNDIAKRKVRNKGMEDIA